MAWPLETLGLVRTLTALVGAVVLVVGVSAYARTRRRSLLLFSTGMGVASAGYLVEGALVEIYGWPLEDATLLESLFSLVAFTLIALGLWVRDDRVTRVPGTASYPTSR